MSNKRKKSHGCRTCLIIFIIIIVLIVAAVAVLLNMTPNKLGLGDIEISEGNTLNSLGFGDVKFIDIIKEFYKLTNTKESDVVTNPYSEEEEASTTETAFANSDFSTDDYSTLLTTKVTYDQQYLIEYKDTTIAYIFNKIVTDSENLTSSLQEVKDAGVSIRELTIYEDSEGNLKMRIVAKFDLSEMMDSLKEMNMDSIVPENLFLVYNVSISANSDGVLTFGSDGVFTINGDNSSAVSEAVINLVEQYYSLEELSNSITNAISDVVNNLGQVGTAEVDDNNVVTSNIILGSSGIKEHYITIITYTTSD